jgi:hypothetical protein
MTRMTRRLSTSASALVLAVAATACSYTKTTSPVAPEPVEAIADSPAPAPDAPNRAPDPEEGGRLPLPDMLGVVSQVAADHPEALRNSCQEHGGSWEFLDLVVDELRRHDTRWGYNGKRGNVADPSKDVVDYHWGRGDDEGSTDVYIIDILLGHCGDRPAPAWIDVTGATANGGSIGRWTSRGRF